MIVSIFGLPTPYSLGLLTFQGNGVGFLGGISARRSSWARHELCDGWSVSGSNSRSCTAVLMGIAFFSASHSDELGARQLSHERADNDPSIAMELPQTNGANMLSSSVLPLALRIKASQDKG